MLKLAGRRVRGAMGDRHDGCTDELALFRQARQRYAVLDDNAFNCLFDACHHAPDEQARIHARTLITYSNIGLVGSIARRFAHGGVPLADLIVEGLMAVYVDSIDNFDPARGRFSTYATAWIKCAIMRCIDNTGGFAPVRLPVHTLDEQRLIRKAQTAFRASYSCEPSFDELLTAVHGLGRKTARAITPKRLGKLLAHGLVSSISLDSPFAFDEDGKTLHDRIGHGEGASSVAALDALDELSVEVQRVKMALESLNMLWRDVIVLRYGLLGDPPMDLGAIGKRCGFSRQWASVIQQKALKTIGRELRKQPAQVDELLRIIGEMIDGPLFTGCSNEAASTPDTLPADGDVASLEEDFTVLSEHATNWRERGEFLVFAPAATLLARQRFLTRGEANACIEQVVAKKWADWVDGADAVKLCRLDKLPESEAPRRQNNGLSRLKHHSFAAKRTPRRMPRPEQVLTFLSDKAIPCGEKRIARPAIALMCVQFRLEPDAAVRLLVELEARKAVASSDGWRSVVILKDRLPRQTRCAELLPALRVATQTASNCA